MAGAVVLLEQVPAKISGEVSPHGMNMVGVILRIVHLDQERRRLHAIVMGVAAVHAS